MTFLSINSLIILKQNARLLWLGSSYQATLSIFLQTIVSIIFEIVHNEKNAKSRCVGMYMTINIDVQDNCPLEKDFNTLWNLMA